MLHRIFIAIVGLGSLMSLAEAQDAGVQNADAGLTPADAAAPIVLRSGQGAAALTYTSDHYSLTLRNLDRRNFMQCTGNVHVTAARSEPVDRRFQTPAIPPLRAMEQIVTASATGLRYFEGEFGYQSTEPQITSAVITSFNCVVVR